MSDNQKNVLKRVVKRLDENKIPFQVLGGVAAIAYGAKRSLYDIDIEVYKKDISRVKELFKDYISKDFYHFVDDNFDIWLLTLIIDDVPVDISQVEGCYLGDGKNVKVYIEANLEKVWMVDFGGIMIPVKDKRELIEYKKILARETDLIDIKQMS